nr:hypothetical protein [Saccharopolyspora sp. HNM0983]
MLVPELTVRPDPDTARLRDACTAAASSLTDVAHSWVAIGADASGPRELGPDTRGTFGGYGVDVPVSLRDGSTADVEPDLPLPALVAGWLRGRGGAQAVRTELLAADTPVAWCRDEGARLVRETGADPSALLVLADGTNCADERSPHAPDPRAPGFDERLRDALATADARTLLDLEPSVAADLGLTGRAALQVAAGVLQASGIGWDAELLLSARPFGVTYHVAVWTARS